MTQFQQLRLPQGNILFHPYSTVVKQNKRIKVLFIVLKREQLSKNAKIWSFTIIIFVFVKVLPVFAAKPKIRGRHSSYTSYSQPYKNTNFQFPFTTKKMQNFRCVEWGGRTKSNQRTTVVHAKHIYFIEIFMKLYIPKVTLLE